jgi:hypothetical protein
MAQNEARLGAMVETMQAAFSTNADEFAAMLEAARGTEPRRRSTHWRFLTSV